MDPCPPEIDVNRPPAPALAGPSGRPLVKRGERDESGGERNVGRDWRSIDASFGICS